LERDIRYRDHCESNLSTEQTNAYLFEQQIEAQSNQKNNSQQSMARKTIYRRSTEEQ